MRCATLRLGRGKVGLLLIALWLSLLVPPVSGERPPVRVTTRATHTAICRCSHCGKAVCCCRPAQSPLQQAAMTARCDHQITASVSVPTRESVLLPDVLRFRLSRSIPRFPHPASEGLSPFSLALFERPPCA